MGPDDWTEEDFAIRLKSALMQLWAQRRKAPISIPELTRNFKTLEGISPNYVKFGCGSLPEFLKRHPKFFQKGPGDTWAINEGQLSEKDKKILNNIIESTYGKKKPPFAPPPQGTTPRGLPNPAHRGGINQARRDTGSRFSAPSSKVTSTAKSNFGGGNNGNALRTDEFNYNTGNSNTSTYGVVYNSSVHGQAIFGHTDFGNRPSHNDVYGNSPVPTNNSRYDEDDYSDNYNRRNNQDDEYDDYGRHGTWDNRSSNNGSRNSYDQYSNNYSDFRESNYDRQYRNDQGPIEPPGYEKAPGPSFSLSERRPGSEFQSGAPPPPPSFSNERPSNFASSHSAFHSTRAVTPPPGIIPPLRQTTHRSIISSPSERDITPPPGIGNDIYSQKEKIPVANLALELLKILYDQWPRFILTSEVKNCFKHHKKPSLANITKEEVGEIVDNLVQTYPQYVVRYPSDQEIRLIYRVGHPPGNKDTQAIMFMKIVTNMLKVREEIKFADLVVEIGVEGREGYGARSTLDVILKSSKDFKSQIGYDPEALPPDRKFWLRENVIVEPWRPDPPNIEFPRSRSSATSTPSLSNLPPSNSSKNASLLKAAKERVLERPAMNAPRVYTSRYPLLSELLTLRSSHPEADRYRRKFSVIIANFEDLANFWVRTLEDNKEFNHLSQAMCDFYATGGDPVSPNELKEGSPFTGEKIAFRKILNHGEERYYRGTICRRYQCHAEVYVYDIGGYTSVSYEDIFILDNTFKALAPLATRCSIGCFRQDYDRKEEFHDFLEMIEEIIDDSSEQTIYIKDEDHLLVELEVSNRNRAYWLSRDLVKQDLIVLY